MFISLTLSVFSTIEGYEVTAGDILFYVESVVVVWFGSEFILRCVKKKQKKKTILLMCEFQIMVIWMSITLSGLFRAIKVSTSSLLHNW